MDEVLREEFASWLSNETWHWTTYGTLTFSRPMRKGALRFAKAWVRSIARTAQSVWGFCFQETHLDGQRLHVHCLLSVRKNLLSQPSNTDMWLWWFQRFGRAVVTDYVATPRSAPKSSQTDALVFDKLAGYLTKYVVKEGSRGGFDWDFYSYSAGKELDNVGFISHNMHLDYVSELNRRREWASSTQ